MPATSLAVSQWHRYLIFTALAGIALGVLAGRTIKPPPRSSGRCSRTKADVSQIAMAIARMRTDTSVTSASCLTNLANLTLSSAPPACLPLDDNGVPFVLKSCEDVTLPPGEICWGGPYLTTVLPDPWQHPYRIELSQQNGAITVRSFGADGVDDHDTWDDVSYVQ